MSIPYIIDEQALFRYKDNAEKNDENKIKILVPCWFLCYYEAHTEICVTEGSNAQMSQQPLNIKVPQRSKAFMTTVHPITLLLSWGLEGLTKSPQ